MNGTLRMQSASQHGLCQKHFRCNAISVECYVMHSCLQTEQQQHLLQLLGQHLQQLLEQLRPHLHEGLKLFQ